MNGLMLQEDSESKSKVHVGASLLVVTKLKLEGQPSSSISFMKGSKSVNI